MARLVRISALAVLAAVTLAATGCGGPEAGTGSGPTGSPATSSTPGAPSGSAAAGPVYQLAGSLCQRADQSPLADLFPTADKPITDTEKLCATSRASKAMAVSLSIDAELLKDATWAQRYYDTAHRLAKSTPTDIPGAGSGAFWTGDKNKVELFSYHGNLVLQVRVYSVNDSRQLPDDLPARLARVAAGTFAQLNP
jgi:hypothetical protein